MNNQNDITAEYYDALHAGRLAEQTAQEVAFIQTLLIDKAQVLDIACGTGRHLVPLCQSSVNMTGIDASEGMLDVLSQKLNQKGLQANLIHGSFNSAIDVPHAYDAIVCLWNAICEIAHTEHALHDFFYTCAKHMRPSGALLIQQSNPLYMADDTFVQAYEATQDDLDIKAEYRTLECDEPQGITRSQETIQIFKQDACIDERQALVIQKWWWPHEVIEAASNAGFGDITVLGDGFEAYSENTDELYFVMHMA